MVFEFIDLGDSVRVKADNKDNTFPKNTMRILSSPLNDRVDICTLEGLRLYEIHFDTDTFIPAQASKEDLLNYLTLFFDSLGGGTGDMEKAIYDTDDNGIVDSAESIAGITDPNQYYGTNGANVKGFYDLVAGGDMGKSTYDTNNNGIVDDSERLGNQLPSYYLNADNHSGTKAQYNDALTDGDFLFVGDVVSNIPTSLSTGTVTSTTYGITSDGSVDDVVIPSATTLLAGLMSAADKVKLDTTLLPPGTALSDNIVINLDTNNTAFTEGGYLISKGNPITDVKIIYYCQSGSTFEVQLYDVTNARIVAQSTGLASTTLVIQTLTLVNPILPGNSILLVRARRTGATSKFIYLKTILIA